MPRLKSKPFLVEERIPLADYSTFGIGGPARYFTRVTTLQEIVQAFQFAREKEIPFFVLGKGSNTLFDDRGFPGLVILNQLSFFELQGTRISVGAGYSFALLGIKAAKKGLAGLEFASGIPASVGGAIYMNAGANGFRTADCLESVTFVSDSGEVTTSLRDELEFGYRFSPFRKMKGAILAATFVLASSREAKSRQQAMITYRKKTQPYGEKSAGCLFRNPSGPLSAGALIEKCGLKGTKIGGACVSTKHANFIVNQGGARATDVDALAHLIEKRIKDETGIELTREVHFVPFDIPS